MLLGLPEISKQHSGANLAESALELWNFYGLQSNLGFVVSDNASNMTTMAEEMEASLATVGIPWDARFHRIRCIGHIVHLAATEFLFPGGADNVNNEPGPDEQEKWRDYGCVGKLHNIVVWVQASPQRMERWRQLSRLQLIRDNKTRWHSYYDMCERALELRAELGALLATESELVGEALAPTDWIDLQQIAAFLKPFRLVTKQTESIYDTLDKVLPAFEFLLRHFELARARWLDNQAMALRIQRAWEKMAEYCNKTDETLVYMAATVLNPLRKWIFFEAHWASSVELYEHLTAGKLSLREYWTTNYAPRSMDTTPTVPPLRCGDDDFEAFLASSVTTRSSRDELEIYLAEDCLDLQDTALKQFKPLSWWNEPNQLARFPNLAKMARDLLSIPAQSSAMERIFSECSRTLTDNRNRMPPVTLELLQLLRSWTRDLGMEQLVSLSSLQNMINDL